MKQEEKAFVQERAEKLKFLKVILKRERISQTMLCEWTGIQVVRMCKCLKGVSIFRDDEKKKILEVFMGKYSEFELFGEEKIEESKKG